VPSFLSPLFPGLLYVLLGILYLLRGQFSDKKVLLIIVALIILGVGALIGPFALSRTEVFQCIHRAFNLRRGETIRPPFLLKRLAS
jgi:hypothetical protein